MLNLNVCGLKVLILLLIIKCYDISPLEMVFLADMLLLTQPMSVRGTRHERAHVLMSVPPTVFGNSL